MGFSAALCLYAAPSLDPPKSLGSPLPIHTGVGAQSSFKAIPLACLAGLVVGLAVGFVIYYGGHSIKDLKIFFVISTVMLFFIAAGQVRFVT